MGRMKIFSTVTAIAVSSLVSASAEAQLDDHIWVGGTGNQQWQVDANWQLNAAATTFPNDPGRVDSVPATITNSEGANLSVNLGANLNVNVGATNVTVAALTIGGTSAAVTTNVTSSGGKLVFENFEQNNTTPEPDVCAFNCGVALITSQGVAGATNTISAIVGANDQIDIRGTGPITFAGGFEEMGGPDNAGSAVGIRALVGAQVFVTGDITTLDIPVGVNTEDIGFGLNSSAASQGTIDVSGVISGPGRVRIGTDVQAPLLPLGTVILRANNTYTGRTILGRGNTIVTHNNALGVGDLKQEGDAGGSFQTGYNLISDSDNRVIANEIVMAQWQTIKGEHSMEFSGRLFQTNQRGWINMLPADKTLTLTGQQYTFELFDGEEERILTFDGKGRTIVKGGIRNRWDADLEVEDFSSFDGSIRMRGTGAVVVDGDNSLPDSDSNFNAAIYVEGGNLHFATDADWGAANRVHSESGAVGVDSGVVNNTAFFALLNNASNPVAGDDAGNLTKWDRGGLMLANGEYTMNLDFSGTGAHVNAANMSLAAHEAGSPCTTCGTYTGTITPGNSTYRFGGGTGTLTLPGTGPQTGPYTANQLTGANGVEIANGGIVKITNTNNYTGVTRIVGEYESTIEGAAAADSFGYDDGDTVPNNQFFRGTTLAVTSLANGGAASSIGSSTNAASNLVIDGSTLRYEGAATSTNRLFTMGTSGATLDASGAGAVSFTNTGAIVAAVAAGRTGNVNAFATGTGSDFTTIRNVASTEGLHAGMTIQSPGLPLTGPTAGIPAGTTIVRVEANDIIIDQSIGASAFYDNTPLTFGPAPERKLTLTGSNAGNNTLASVVANASDGGLVGVTKTGPGKWILTGNNTYTGATSVENGVLSISNPFLANSADVFMTPGGVLDLNFVGSDVIDELFFSGVGQATGTWGAIGNASADFQSAFFTGAGLLQVSTAPTHDADFNNDGVVSAADYVVWRKFNGLTGDGTLSTGDANADEDVDDIDYNIWRHTFGGASPGGGGSGAVPEPASGLLFGLALIGLLSGLRRDR